MTIEDRLERLERQNRRLKWAFMVVPLCAITLAVLSGQTPSPKNSKKKTQFKTIKATKFVLVDKKGKTLASLRRSEAGIGGSLVFYEGRAKTLEVGTPGGHLGIVLWHKKKKGKLSLMLSSNRNGVGFLELYDEEGSLKDK